MTGLPLGRRGGDGVCVSHSRKDARELGNVVTCGEGLGACPVWSGGPLLFRCRSPIRLVSHQCKRTRLRRKPLPLPPSVFLLSPQRRPAVPFLSSVPHYHVFLLSLEGAHWKRPPPLAPAHRPPPLLTPWAFANVSFCKRQQTPSAVITQKAGVPPTPPRTHFSPRRSRPWRSPRLSTAASLGPRFWTAAVSRCGQSLCCPLEVDAWVVPHLLLL